MFVNGETLDVPPMAPCVVGIGASAGGLEALRVLVRLLPPGLGACFAVAQHLSPTHRSMLVELLARETSFRVVEIADGLVPEADCVYVTPATCHVRFVGGAFRLEPASQAGIPKPSVDEFFGSLAAAFEERAIGVILSGTGSDGARGVRAIHAAGGCTLAQDPVEAKYDGMPRAAIESGCIDFVAGVAALGPQLARLLALGPEEVRSEVDNTQSVPVIDRIVQAVKRRAGFDLSLYKPRSLERRIRRRVVATESHSMEAYADLLQSSPQEVERVVREMFISVTQFFRDSEAFAALNVELGQLLAQKPEGEELRVWVPGCATGEEAYSLAMLIAEHFERLQRWPQVRLFATDLDTAALTKARRGIFSAAASTEVPAKLAAKYLTVDGDVCHIVKRLRELVIFSEHNILHDPAFLRLDLVSCRNLLIYLQPAVQHQVLSTFAHALKPGGLLFLGKAEALYANSDLFSVLDGAGHLYRSLGNASWMRATKLRQPLSLPRETAPRIAGKAFDVGSWLAQAHAAGVLAPFVLVDDAGTVLHVFGDVSAFLRLGAGLATLDVLQLAIEPIRLELRSTLLHAQRQRNQRVSAEASLGDGQGRVQLTAMRREEPGAPPMTLVMFESRKALPVGDPTGDGLTQHATQRAALEDQLTATREHLSTVISELESTNEELQSLNEEMQSANEELQSANEELETSNEELQSTNEELITVNEELESRTAELSLLNSDLHNVKNSQVDPIIVVDEHRRVTLFNPPATQIFALDASSVGALLFSLPCLIDIGQAVGFINDVIESGQLRETQLVGERCYLMRVQPYRDSAGASKGAVLTFHDNTALLQSASELAAANQRIRAAERFVSATINALSKQIGVVDATGRLVSANTRWHEAATRADTPAAGCVVGDNLLAALDAGGDMLAPIAAGLRSVLARQEPRFVLEYAASERPGAPHYRTVVTPFDDTSAAEHWVVTHEDITERRRQEAQIRLQARALNSALSGITIADATQPDLPLVYVNQAFQDITGYTQDEVLGLNCRLLQGGESNQPALLALRSALARRQPVRSLLRNYRKDGTLFWNELTLAPIIDDGKLTHFVGMQRDMTAILASEELLQASLARESQALAFAGLGSLEIDIRAGRVNLSERHARLLGLPGEQRSMALNDYRRFVLDDDLPVFDDGIKLCVAGHSPLDVDYRVVWVEGTQHWLHTRGNATIDAQGVASRILALSQDVSARKGAEDQVRFIAHHDALTGLPNRALLRDRFQLALNGARRNRNRLALIFIDLDHFKDINDALGHEGGDALLVSVAERMRAAVRDTDTICRQSGDEFIALLPSVRDANDAAHLAEKLIERIAQPHEVGGQTLRVTCSAGVSLYPEDGETIELLMRHADSAMYHAKGLGRNKVELYAREMNQQHQDRVSIASALRLAVERQELRLHYQPQFDVLTGDLRGVEALLRWQHPERGLVLPDVFIGVAEESDLIVSIGDWALREACRQARQWQDAGLALRIAVNVSPVQLRQRSIIEKVVAALHDHGLDGRSLELELTERALIHNADSVGALLADFRNEGIRLALDDFGTGYSSLSYLHRFPVDKLKIDRSFVAASPGDASAAAIVRAVINLAQSMGLDIVAEGVETLDQLAFLQASGCVGFQGFLSGPVGTPDDLLRHAQAFHEARSRAMART